MKKAQSKFYKKPVRSFADGGSMEFDATGRNKPENQMVDQIGQSTASAFGPWWGALAGAGTAMSQETMGDGRDKTKNAEGIFMDPFNQFKNNEDTDDWIGSFANPVAATLVKAERMADEYAKNQRNIENQQMASNVKLGNTINNSIPSFTAPAYGRKGMKFKSKFGKQC